MIEEHATDLVAAIARTMREQQLTVVLVSGWSPQQTSLLPGFHLYCSR
ncbi:MAG TPA: hypothetical protein VF792_06875 [Ktedonobacterales bacterium]